MGEGIGYGGIGIGGMQGWGAVELAKGGMDPLLPLQGSPLGPPGAAPMLLQARLQMLYRADFPITPILSFFLLPPFTQPQDWAAGAESLILAA